MSKIDFTAMGSNPEPRTPNPESRVVNPASRFQEIHPALDAHAAAIEANRCLFCYDAPCTAACPTHIDVPRFIKKIATDNLRGSALTILNSNVLGLSCARVCPVDVLCEGACVMVRENYKPIEIGRLQRFAMDRFYEKPDSAWSTPSPITHTERVGCVGGGPASLACAAELRRRGYAVTVIDNRPLPGGLNTYGVAEYKLRPQDSLREVDMIRSLGVEFRQALVGDTISLESVEKEFSLVFLGMGLGTMQRLGIPGESLHGVIDALRLIERYKTAPDFQVRGRVVVIGGGNTAIDAANAARRLGAAEVHLFYRRTEREMPAFRSEFDRSKVEGVRFHWLAQPMEIIGFEGNAAAVRFVETRLGAPDHNGRCAITPVPGSQYQFACDMVIPAIGQERLTSLLENTRGITVKNGLVVVDRPTGRTTNPRYFAGGDCVNGGREVVDAVADGKRAALAMAAQLEKSSG
ncbi:MAG: NAD(P)-dependent oxidoreductase [Acidobacteriota bacterium]|nr:NAD(P)-dependent oxidoreductase [Acidobacteriota bacterium]